MSLSPSDITDILHALNQSGQSIPLSVTASVATEPIQFWSMFILSVIGSGFLIMVFGSIFVRPTIQTMYLKIALRKFKKITGRNYILIKHTRTGMFESSMIDSDTLHDVEVAIQSFKGKPFDIILHTPGGVIFYTQLLAKIIKENKMPIRCFVPYYAMSGGTMLALSCAEIHMGRLACLGPVDPQIGSLFGYGSAQSWKEVIRKKGRRAGDSAIQYAFMGEQYTKTLRENLHYALADKISEPEMMDKALDYLTSGSIEHAYQISPLKLAEFGVKITPIPEEIQSLLSNVLTKSWVEGVVSG